MQLSGGLALLLLPCLAAAALAVVGGAGAYQNYTVGGDKGWYDGLGVDYQQWADGNNFSLGDFLIFNTDKNHSVVQTRNGTLYKSCDSNDSGPDDTVEWSAAGAGAPEFSKDAVTVAVPLLREGRTYFFSGDYDGEQCESGQRFGIDVAHGQGLPPDLRPPAPGPAPAPAADGAPVFDFSHPKNVTTPSASDWAGSDEPGGGGAAASGSAWTARAAPGLAGTLLTVLFAAYH